MACSPWGRGGWCGRIAGAVVAALALWLAWPVDVAVASNGVVRCESDGMARVHCAMDTGDGVELVRQISEHACIRESDWGVDADGVWVARGCRAEFAARNEASAATRSTIRCESRNGRLNQCPVRLRGAPVRLLRELSAVPCRRDESWGIGRNEVWVSRGCKGEFEIGSRDGGFPPGPRLLTCESKQQQRRSCGTTITHGARLVRQLSGMPCTEGQTWGWDAGRVWVDNGCRAEFSVE
ncbi:DUF3011 domain-containing protein [Pseudoxanthomonas koreensis]|uniref:DUF3011 domain-containing protein n=1 Tax=Pseudoxanthomonas koreensis TaxID=266061 RepID=UPI00139134D7|nr:DUF3011 domain-containing protein [Pseudoxanthomonas koreensis]KAF1697815.1 hypothetical protein CSC64_00590 [Pseudoxanthomonas koreensis]